MTTWTTFDDVDNRWIGDDLPADETKVNTLISDAEDTILREYPTIQTRIDDEDIPVERVVKVVCRMVIRHLNNPTGTRQKSEGAGPYQQSVTYGGEEPGTLYLTSQDRRELEEGTAGSKAFTIDNTPAYNTTQAELESLWWGSGIW